MSVPAQAGTPARAHHDAQRWAVGIDVGGTGTRTGAIRLDTAPPSGRSGDSRATVRVADGPGVLISGDGVDHRALLDVLHAALGHLRDVVADGRIVAAAIGLTGFPDLVTDRAALVERLTAEFELGRVVLAADAVTAHMGALALRPGTVLAAGTGVVALSVDRAGRLNRTGGWGHLLGDDGGGAWIGEQGLRAAFRQLDGRRDGSARLLTAVRDRFGDPDRLPSTLYTRGDRAATMARFTPDVIGAATEGDAVALRIVAQAGALLAETAHSAIRRSGVQLVSHSGRLLSTDGPLLTSLREHLREQAPNAELVMPHGSPLDGAMSLARLAADDPDRVPRDATLIALDTNQRTETTT